MSGSVLVVSSVHPPDDPRIRRKLIETLKDDFSVTYAVQNPGPTNRDGIRFRPLPGGRLRRMMTASWLLISGSHDVASVHDPELLPAAWIRAKRGRRVVFDCHENIPAQIRHKKKIPAPLRGALSRIVARMLRIAEGTLEISLAESGYTSLFSKPHPVFPNTLIADLPDVTPIDTREGVVYLGDITQQRGIDIAVEALSRVDGKPTLTLIGRCSEAFSAELLSLASRLGVEVRFAGYLEHAAALELMSRHRVAISPLRDIPNYRNSMPTKLLEYLAVGLPVVSSDLPGSRDELRDADGIVWVHAGDMKALADGINRALSNGALAGDAVASANTIRRNFRWPADEVRAFYGEAAPERSAG